MFFQYYPWGNNNTGAPYDNTGTPYDDTGAPYDDTAAPYDDTRASYDSTGTSYDNSGGMRVRRQLLPARRSDTRGRMLWNCV